MPTTTTKGLNNVTDPLRLDLSWLVEADNVDVTDTGALVRRTGYEKTLAGSMRGAFSTFDFSRMYVVDGGALKVMTGFDSAVTLKNGLAAAPMHWAEINDQVFFNNGVDSGVILPDNTVLDWRWPEPPVPTVSKTGGSLAAGRYQVRCAYTLADGRVTGASDSIEIDLGEGEALLITNIPKVAGATTNVFIAPADSTVYQFAGAPVGTAMTWNASQDALGYDLTTILNDPLPLGTDVIQFWRGRAYAAQYLPNDDATAVWFSQPLGFHLFNLNSDFIMVPGRVLMLAPHDDALLIGTTERVYAYDGKELVQLAPYGVVPGWHWAKDDTRVLFWSTRGVCSYSPFKNLTERQVSVAPGLSAGGAVVRSGGQKRYLVALQQGGAAFNPFT